MNKLAETTEDKPAADAGKSACSALLSADYPPCMICGGPNDMGEVCLKCAENNDPFGVDLEGSGGFMVQDGRGR